MKNLTFLSLLFISLTTFGQEKEIAVYRNSNEVTGMEQIQEITAKSSKAFGKQEKLRKMATEKLIEQAKNLNADAICIFKDEFSYSPINNVALVAVAYKKSSAKAESNSGTSDYIDELRKLKALLDEKVITQEEYDTKKKAILER